MAFLAALKVAEFWHLQFLLLQVQHEAWLRGHFCDADFSDPITDSRGLKPNLAQKTSAASRVEEVVSREADARNQLEELYRHNAEEKARYEREREEMLERLKSSEAKASKFERMPRWVVKLFGI